MLNRVELNQAIRDLKIDAPKRPTKPTRGLAVRWGAHTAKQEFKDYGQHISKLGKELKDHHGFKSIVGNVFDVSFFAVFGTIETVFTATVKVIHGLAGAILHPSLIIKKSNDVYKSKESEISSEDPTDLSTQATETEDTEGTSETEDTDGTSEGTNNGERAGGPTAVVIEKNALVIDKENLREIIRNIERADILNEEAIAALYQALDPEQLPVIDSPEKIRRGSIQMVQIEFDVNEIFEMIEGEKFNDVSPEDIEYLKAAIAHLQPKNPTDV